MLVRGERLHAPVTAARRACLLLLVASSLLACTPSDQPRPPGGDDTAAALTQQPDFNWLGTSVSDTIVRLPHQDDGQVRFPGLLWWSLATHSAAPTLATPSGYETILDVTNCTPLDIQLHFDGLPLLYDELLTSAEIRGNETSSRCGGGRVVVSHEAPPGVYLYTGEAGTGVRTPDASELARRGLFGFYLVYGPDEVWIGTGAVEGTLALVDLPARFTELDTCRVDVALDTGPAAPCPNWVDAAADLTVAVAQRIQPNPMGDRRIEPPWFSHNVTTLPVDAGQDLRLNLGSLSDTSHTLDLGGLTWTDPETGASVVEVRLDPGETTHLLLRAPDLPGEHVVRCVDHDHLGLDELRVRVE